MIEIKSRTSALSVTAFGAISFLLFWLNIFNLQSHNASAAAVGMSDMHMNNMAKFWAIPVIQGSGMAAILAAFISILFGLQQSRKATGWLNLNYQSIDRLHRHLSLLVLVLVTIHVWATWADATGSVCTGVFWFNQCEAAWPDAVWAYDLGIFGFYLAILLGLSYYLRHKIGVQLWKFAHRFTILFYVASVWHTLVLGLAKEDYPVYFRPVFWLMQLVVLWFMAKRFREMLKKNAPKSLASKLTISALIGLCGLASIFVLATVVVGLTSNSIYWLNIT
jgi:methionine sulfoxide reductase heme-binding subunit